MKSISSRLRSQWAYPFGRIHYSVRSFLSISTWKHTSRVNYCEAKNFNWHAFEDRHNGLVNTRVVRIRKGISVLSVPSKRKILPFCPVATRSIAVDTCEEGDIDGRSAKCSRENNFGRQPSTVPTDARDSCGRSNLYSEVEV